MESQRVPQLDNAWNGDDALSHSEILKQIHKEYTRSRAEIIISNTFAILKNNLLDEGVEEDFDSDFARLTLGEPPPLLEDVIDLLETGDLVTHAFNGKPRRGNNRGF